MNRGTARAVGIAIGFVADRVFRDPARFHPVAGFGTVASRLEASTYRDSRSAGVGHVGLLVGATVGVAAMSCCASDRVYVSLTAAATWTALGGSSLSAMGAEFADRALANDITAARDLLPSLCGRDPAALDMDGLVRAALESVAENTSDATVAPLFWGAVAGVPGLLGYRAVNTLDAMVGYRNERYEHFGWAAARIDDAANLVPARIAGALTVALAPVVGGSPRRSLEVWRRDARRHPSPNAGVVEASAAGALGVALGGPTAYRHGVEDRPRLGTGPAPTATDLLRAVRLSNAVQLGSAALAVAVCQLVLGRHRRDRFGRRVRRSTSRGHLRGRLG